jgi:hypothetical protein
MADLFENPVLIKVFENHISGKFALRLYQTERDKRYRWHFGYPKEIIDPLLPLLETTPYWGERHWAEHEGFYLYFLYVLTGGKDVNAEIMRELNREDKSLMGLYNDCLSILKAWASKAL